MNFMKILGLAVQIGPEVINDYTTAKAAFAADQNNVAKAKTALATAEKVIEQLGSAALEIL